VQAAAACWIGGRDLQFHSFEGIGARVPSQAVRVLIYLPPQDCGSGNSQNCYVRIGLAESMVELEIILFVNEASRTGQPIGDAVVRA
jgi:hypothetical protein